MKKVQLPELPLSELVYSFALAMQEKLDENRNKHGWDELTPFQCIERIKEEFEELTTAVDSHKTEDKVTSECVDVANFAAFLAWNYSQACCSTPDTEHCEQCQKIGTANPLNH